MRFLVTGESSYADGRFGRSGVATILFIRRRKPPASPWRREWRSGAEQADGTDKTCNDGGRRERGKGGQFVSHFISGLGHPSADSPPSGRHR